MKYINADELIAEIEKRLKSLHEWKKGWKKRLPLSRNKTYYKNLGKESAYDAILNIITSLQQKQPKVDLVAELEHHLATTPKEQLDKEWKELEPWSKVGPTVQEFLYGKQP